MAINNYPTRVQFISSGQDSFTFPFEIFEKDDIVVYVNNELKVRGTDYSVSGEGVSTGGTVDFLTDHEPNAGDVLVIFRSVPNEREIDYQSQGSFRAINVNEDMDRIWAKLQEHDRDLDRTLHLPVTETSASLELPEDRRNKVLGFDDDSDVKLYTPYISENGSNFRLQFDTISDMLDASELNIEGDVVYVKGYHAAGDGGGGTFIRLDNDFEHIHDGGMIFRFAGSDNVWKRIVDQASDIDIRWFGARPIENYNEGNEVAHWINEAVENAGRYLHTPGTSRYGYGCIYVPPGNWAIQSPTVPGTAGIIIPRTVSMRCDGRMIAYGEADEHYPAIQIGTPASSDSTHVGSVSRQKYDINVWRKISSNRSDRLVSDGGSSPHWEKIKNCGVLQYGGRFCDVTMGYAENFTIGWWIKSESNATVFAYSRVEIEQIRNNYLNLAMTASQNAFIYATARFDDHDTTPVTQAGRTLIISGTTCTFDSGVTLQAVVDKINTTAGFVSNSIWADMMRDPAGGYYLRIQRHDATMSVSGTAIADLGITSGTKSKSDGWCNQNHIQGGSLQNSGSWANGTHNRYGVLLAQTGSGFTPNNNVFKNVAFELQPGGDNSTSFGIIFENATFNRVENMRNEFTDYACNFTRGSYFNRVDVLWNSSRQFLNESGNAGNYVYDQSSWGHEGVGSSWNSGSLAKRAANYGTGGFIYIPGMFTVTSSNDTLGSATNNITVNGDWIEMSTTRGIGVRLDTSVTKRFYVTLNVALDQYDAGRCYIGVRPRDAAGNSLTTTTPANEYVTGDVRSNWAWFGSSYFGGIYRTGGASFTGQVFEVTDDVKSVDVMIIGNTTGRVYGSTEVSSPTSTITVSGRTIELNSIMCTVVGTTLQDVIDSINNTVGISAASITASARRIAANRYTLSLERGTGGIIVGSGTALANLGITAATYSTPARVKSFGIKQTKGSSAPISVSSPLSTPDTTFDGRRMTNAVIATDIGKTYVVGDVMWNIAPSAGSPTGWVCVTAGMPGTWAAFGALPLTASTTFNPGSIAVGASESTTVTLTGAALGDYVEVSFSQNLDGVTISGYVSSTNTVTVLFTNHGTVDKDLASGTLRARITKY